VDQTDSRTLFDTSAERVTAGLYLPDYSDGGYFALDLEPEDGVATQVTAPFVPFPDLDPIQVRMMTPLLATVLSTEGDDGWEISVFAGPPKRQ
jgi:hypothetical protein